MSPDRTIPSNEEPFILELLSSGMSIEDILADYDDLEREDILAALMFAARLTQVKSIKPNIRINKTTMIFQFCHKFLLVS